MGDVAVKREARRRLDQNRARRFGVGTAPGGPSPWRAWAALFVLGLWSLAVAPTAAARPFAFGLHVREPMGLLPMHIGAAADAGARAVSVVFAWDEVEPAPGRFVVEEPEALLRRARERGMHVVGVLAYPRDVPLATAAASTGAWPSGHVDDWAFFVAHVVSRFADRVDGWVVDGRRPPEAADLFQRGEAEQYAAFVRLTSGTVRRHEPRKPLLAAAPGTDVVFLQQFAHFGGLAAVDGLALDVNRWPAAPSGLGVVIGEVEEAARRAGEAPLLWVWEFGYPTHRDEPAEAAFGAGPGPVGGSNFGAAAGGAAVPAAAPWPGVSEERQAAYLVQSSLRLLAAGVQTVFVKELFDAGPDPFAPEDNFGLRRWNMQPKPALQAYKTLTRLLGGLHYARAGDVIRRPAAPGADEEEPAHHFIFDFDALQRATEGRAERVAAHVFTGENRTVIVLWTEPAVGTHGGCRDGCGQVDILPWLHGVPVRGFDMYGEAVLEQKDWPPGPEPLYLELPMEMVL